MSRFIICFFFLFASASFAQDLKYNVDRLPDNVGGKAEFRRVFHSQLQYPAEELSKNVSGVTSLAFVIRKDGSVTGLRIYSSSGNANLDKEALRIFRLYRWVPAVKLGEYVSSEWYCSFEFSASRYKKICKERGYEAIPVRNDYPVDTSMTIVREPSQLPMYPDGQYALQDFIRNNLDYPRQAALSNLQGTVVLRFVVEPSGLITNMEIDKSVGGGCNEEAIRVLQMIRWFPGILDGKFVRTEMTFPFYFVLNDEFRDNAAGEQK